MLFKREKRGRGWLINEAYRKARALTEQPTIFDILFEWTQTRKKNSFNHCTNNCTEAVKLTTRILLLEFTEQTISSFWIKCLIDEQVCKKIVLLFLRGLSMISRRRFFPLQSAFESEGALAPRRTRVWIFMIPIWAPENKAWVCICMMEGASYFVVLACIAHLQY